MFGALWKSVFGARDDRIIFFTHYGQKFEEVSKLLGATRVTQMHFDGLPTFEDLDLADLAVARAKELHKVVRRPCFLEEASLAIDGTDFPGHEFRCIVGNKKYFRQWVRENAGKAATIRLCVGFVDAEGKAHSFESSQRGTIVVPKTEDAWQQGIGWDPIWAPQNFSGRTLGEMLAQKHFVDVRLQLYLTLRELINPNVDGTFEIHLTMALPESIRKSAVNAGSSSAEEIAAVVKEGQELIERFKRACEVESLRALVIFEDHSTPAAVNKQLQLQTAIYRCFPSVAAASAYAYTLSTRFETEYGLRVARTRAEAMAHGRLAPKTTEEAMKAPRDYYFEFHRRLGVSLPANEVATVEAIAKRYSKGNVHAHVSRVANKAFLNCRFFSMGCEEATTIWDAMEAEILAGTSIIFVKKTLCEYAVLDDDPNFDDRPDGLCATPPVVYDALLKSMDQP